MKFRELFSGPDGEASSTRFAFLLWTIWVLVIWSVASLRLQPDNTLKLAAIPDSVTIILGILMTGKVVQRFAEPPDKPTAAQPPAGNPPPAGSQPPAGPTAASSTPPSASG